MTVAFVDRTVRVRTPATSANLGPGFDALGLAHGLYDEVAARVADGLSIDVDGEGRDVPRDESHLVVRAMRTTFDRLGGQPRGLALECTNRIPHGRGLGSSASAIVAGVLLARGLVDGGAELLPTADVLALAAEIEGHPDNVAACVLGGLTVAWTDGAGSHAVQVPASGVDPVLFVPPFESSTKAARGLLPATVSHGDASFAAGRAALLVACLAGGADALLAATEDRLHQDYREPVMPESIALVRRLRADGLPAVVSGAGPTVLVLARGDVEVEQAGGHAPAGWVVHRLPVDGSGAREL